jgi:hypothetical protein
MKNDGLSILFPVSLGNHVADLSGVPQQ